MFERFTDRARRVLVLAQEEARLLNHSFIGTEHVLLGLVHEEQGIAAQALRALDVSLEAVREKVEETVGAVGTAPSGSPPFTPRAKKVLELSLREAIALGHSNIDTEHLLLGLVREGEGVAAQVLVGLGADLGRVRQQVIQLMSGEQAGRPMEPPDAARHPAPFRRQPAAGEGPPWLRCALCGRSLWETARFVTGAEGRVCEECARAAAGMLEHAAPEPRELVLPPRVTGRPPDDDAVAAVVATVQAAFGPNAGPSTWSTTVEDPERFVPLLPEAALRWGLAEAVHPAEVGFVTPELAYVRFHVRFASGSQTTTSGQLRRHGDRWLVTAETLGVVLRRAGIRSEVRAIEPVVVGVPPDDRAVEGVTAAIGSVFGSEHSPEAQAGHLEDAEGLAPYLRQAQERLPAMVSRTWLPRVLSIRFTAPDAAEVHFALESAGARPTFSAAVRRHGDRWMVTRDSMVAVLARGGIVVPPRSTGD